MAKPSWISAPKWANYLTQDYQGCWFWHEELPYVPKYGMRWNSNRRSKRGGGDSVNVNFKTTLEYKD